MATPINRAKTTTYGEIFLIKISVLQIEILSLLIIGS